MLRWLAVPPAAVVAAAAACALTVGVFQIVFAMCPASQRDVQATTSSTEPLSEVVGVTCTAPWYPTAVNVFLALGICLSLGAAVMAGRTVAPAHKLASGVACAALLLVAGLVVLQHGA